MKIKTITPIHIGTGNTKMPIQYKSFDEEYICYDLEDLLSSMPIDRMMDERFLSSLNKSNENKKILIDQFRKYANYRNITPKYQCMDGADIGNLDVYEQMKSMITPIIPGSSIKGAIVNAVYYYFLKQHLPRIQNQIMHNNSKYDLLDIRYYLRLIFGMDKNEIKTFLNIVSSSLLCSDISFSTMEIVKAYRIFKSKKPMPMGCMECISPELEVSGNFIQFDENNHLLKDYESPLEIEFINCFKLNNLSKACNIYFLDMLKLESSKQVQDLYRNNKMGEVNDLILQLKKESSNTNHCFLRVGKNTNFFFKSITGLFKKELPEFYKRNFDLFKPSARNSKIKLSPETMPSTRVILNTFEENTLSGFVELEFDD